MKIYTVGVYGKTEEEFFSLLTDNQIDTFLDIRQRRGVRGSLYRFVNSNYLQMKLKQMDVNYLYKKELAPTTEIREKQWAEDRDKNETKKLRTTLSSLFSNCYCSQILDSFDFEALIRDLEIIQSENVVLFCVESVATACHRSLLAKRLKSSYGFEVINL